MSAKMNTKYYKTWEEYKAQHPEIEDKQAGVMAPKMQSYEDMMFEFVIYLLL
ncbi:hypothetical protein ABDB91_18220 [Desulfoscipio sp. XC116]|uniref:hypothetical protein n=1 Tax=Desulfoscipio sp. XC116 TaxID=3144975 RepID=UPI00325A765D